MTEKQNADEGLLCCLEQAEVLSCVFGKIREASPGTAVWFYDMQQEKWFRREPDGRLIPVLLRSENDGDEWLFRTREEAAVSPTRLIVGDGYAAVVSFSIYSKGVCRGELAAGPVYAEHSTVETFRRENSACQVIFDPELARILPVSDSAGASGDEGFLLKTVFCLMQGARRYLESCLHRLNIQREANILKNNYANAEQEYQELCALTDSLQHIRRLSTPAERFFSTLVRVRKGRTPAESYSGAAQMEEDLIRMRQIFMKWQGKLCPIRTEAEFVRLYLRIRKRMMDSRFRTEIHIPKECMDLQIPFGTLQSLVEAPFGTGLGSFRGQGILSVYFRRDGDSCRISFSDRGYVMPEARVRELMNLRFATDPCHMADILQKENCRTFDRMILHMQAVCGGDFRLDIASDAQTGTKIQMQYRCL